MIITGQLPVGPWSWHSFCYQLYWREHNFRLWFRIWNHKSQLIGLVILPTRRDIKGGDMRTLTTILVAFMLLWGPIQVAFSGIIPAEFRNNNSGILSLRNTESFDFRVQTIELDGIVLDTVTTIQQNDFQFSSEFSNGGKILFTPTSVFANVTAGTIDMELIAYNGTVATVNLNAGHSIEFEPHSFTIISSQTNTENVSVFIDEAEFFVSPGERKQIVSIYIAPLRRGNPIRKGEYGIIPVVIYGSATLDVNRIDLDSLLLSGDKVQINSITNDMAVVDHINNDSYPDLVVAFKNIEKNFIDDLNSAILMGHLSDGTTISGTADVSIAQ